MQTEYMGTRIVSDWEREHQLANASGITRSMNRRIHRRIKILRQEAKTRAYTSSINFIMLPKGKANNRNATTANYTRILQQISGKMQLQMWVQERAASWQIYMNGLQNYVGRLTGMSICLERMWQERETKRTVQGGDDMWLVKRIWLDVVVK